MSSNISNSSIPHRPRSLTAGSRTSENDTPSVRIGGRIFTKRSSDSHVTDPQSSHQDPITTRVRRSLSLGSADSEKDLAPLPGINPPPPRPSGGAALDASLGRSSQLDQDQAPLPGSYPPPPRASEETATTYPQGPMRERSESPTANENIPPVPPTSPAPKMDSRPSTPPPSASASAVQPRVHTAGPRILNPDLLTTADHSPSASSSTAPFSRRSNSAGSSQLSPSPSLSTARPRSRTVGERTKPRGEPLAFTVNPLGPLSPERLQEPNRAPSSPPLGSPRQSLLQRASASISSMMPSLGRRSSFSHPKPEDFLAPPHMNESAFILPKDGTLYGEFFNHRSRTGKQVVATVPYQEARPIGGGGSSKAYVVSVNKEDKVIIVNTTMTGLFPQADLATAILPYRTIYYDFFRYLRDNLVRCEGMGGVPDAQDAGSLRLTFVMEKLEPLHLDDPHFLAKELMKISDKMKKYKILHRDVKPDNLLFRGVPGKSQTLVLIDLFDTGTTAEYLERLQTPRELAEHLGSRLAVSPLYSHPEYPKLSQAFNISCLSDLNVIRENKQRVIDDYISRELANQEVQVAMTIWSFFLGDIPSSSETTIANLSLMREKWATVECDPSIKEFVSTRLQDNFLTSQLGV